MYEVRMAKPGDAEQIAAIYRPIVEQTVISMEEVAPTPNEIRSRIAAVVPTWPWLVADDSGTILGYAYASRHRERAAYRWSVDVSVYVAEPARRRGVARTLYGELFWLLALQGYYRAYAGITVPNEASIGLHRALGFSPVGFYRAVGFKFGRWWDVAWLERSLRGDEAPSADPVPLTILEDEIGSRLRWTSASRGI